ncbi:MAG: hypothetical protein FJ256_00190 [Phycisphaerae bacterium]|nr:hypothetical protein [Phycisphaerae bacterium]
MGESEGKTNNVGTDTTAGSSAATGATTTPAVGAAPPSWQRPSWLRIVLALGIAIASDVFSFLTSSLIITFPAVFAVDALTATLLWLALGRPLLILPILAAEAIPGVGTLPLWTLAVVLISIFGRIPGRDPSKALTEVSARLTNPSAVQTPPGQSKS